MTNFHLVDTGWSDVLNHAMSVDSSAIRLVCPFIKRRVVEQLLRDRKPRSLQVITRFNLGDFCDGVSDIEALRLLLKNGAAIRGVRNLHAKLYLFGDRRAIVTSANLTTAALHRNHEFGFVADELGIVKRCHQYFDDLWGRAGQDLTEERLAGWDRMVTDHLACGARPTMAMRLGDEGVDADILMEPARLPAFIGDSEQTFVKFFGESRNRADRSTAVFDEVQRSGCHWACTYPKGKRPRQVRNGAVMFMGRLVKDPNDILIYGRAIAMRHDATRDNATAADIVLRPWKVNWPHYIKVHHCEFIAGELGGGISLNELMDSLKSDAFLPTQKNAAKGEGNTDPRRAYMQQAAVELTPQASIWLNERLQLAYAQHGILSPSAIDQLDWPEIPILEDKAKVSATTSAR